MIARQFGRWQEAAKKQIIIDTWHFLSLPTHRAYLHTCGMSWVFYSSVPLTTRLFRVANFKSDPPTRARIVGYPHICLCIRTRPAKLSWYKSRTMPVSLPKIRIFQRINFVSFKTAVILKFQTSSAIFIIPTLLKF